MEEEERALLRVLHHVGTVTSRLPASEKSLRSAQAAGRPYVKEWFHDIRVNLDAALQWSHAVLRMVPHTQSTSLEEVLKTNG